MTKLIKAKLDVQKCGDCNVILDCHAINGKTTHFAIYPPDNVKEEVDDAKCYCNVNNFEKYKNCVLCHYQNVLNNEVTAPRESEINKKCLLINNNGQTKQIDTNAQTPNQTQNPTNNQSTAVLPNNQNVNGTAIARNSTVSGNNAAKPTISPINTDKDNKNDSNDGKSSNSSKIIIFSVIGVVVAVAIIGFFVYNNKKKSRPESMPFFSNSATSPRTFATLDIPKDNNLNNYGSTSPLNYDYNQNSNYDNQYNQYGQYGTEYQQFDSVSNSVSNNVSNNAYVSSAALAVNDNSINYDPRRESMNQSANLSLNEPSNGPYCCCTYPYDPKLDDELELRVNDEIQVIEEFEDGWMKAYNKTTNKEGMAPIVCIKPLN
ncbi:hypothetical protein PIROE2DRAFT_17926 [Piromyces sp. E2]|nr:hypothetical protein PIROE2DRAFT_17926 [Piromyces sp. E2]|eukprot:OUM57166.1 hypothetical protein PIROE2DRAFT_17926 [Piromyces sp. E2]